MSWRTFIDSLFGRPPTPPDDEDRVMLDGAEMRQADRLSKLTGRRRDEVLAESYRRADKILAGKRR